MLNYDALRPPKKGSQIDEKPTIRELTEALATKGYRLIGLERVCPPAENLIFTLTVRDTRSDGRFQAPFDAAKTAYLCPHDRQEIDPLFFDLFENVLKSYIDPIPEDLSNDLYRALVYFCQSRDGEGVSYDSDEFMATQ